MASGRILLQVLAKPFVKCRAPPRACVRLVELPSLPLQHRKRFHARLYGSVWGLAAAVVWICRERDAGLYLSLLFGSSVETVFQ